MPETEQLDVIAPRDEAEKKELVKRALDEVYGPEAKKIFWKETAPAEAKGGIYYRAFDLVEFIKKVENDNRFDEVVGIVFDGSHNIELLVKEKEDKQ